MAVVAAVTTTNVMRKSIDTGRVYLHLMLVLIMCCALSTAGSASSSTDINNSLNPYSPSTSGSILASSSSSSSSSTAQSLLETYLQTFPINEQQNVLTTVYQPKQYQHASTVDAAEKEKMTTISSEVAYSSITTHSAASAAIGTASTESSQSSNNQNTQETPVVISQGPSSQQSSSTILTTTTNESEPIPIAPVEHVLLGCGPNNREGIGIQKALDWLKEKRFSDYGWENDTHMVILAKELSNGRESNDNDGHLQMITELEDLLSIKQMEIDILNMLDKHNSKTMTIPKPIEPDRLARYILSLSSLCKDPRHFYGHDLVSLLQHHDTSQDDEFALAALATCSSAIHVRKRQIRRLLDVASGEINNVDTMAMVLLALRCIITDHRHRHLQHFIRRPALGLAGLQMSNGSFGSLKSTALAMQALQDLQLDGSTYNRTAASKWILDSQRSDGAWSEEPLHDGQDANVGIGLTADVILALGCKGLGAVRALQCDHVIDSPGNGNGDSDGNGEPKSAQPYGLPPVSTEDTEQKNVSYSYTLWLESNITETYSLQLVSPKNTSFFKAMTQAADIDPKFSFEAREWPNGHYIHTLAGKKEEPTLYHYWLLYRLPEIPDPESPPGNQLIAPVGVDELMVEDGEHYLYWYKKL
ncbi:hypothetical protein PVAND_002992 [Polypedilum vanderplanki]|uniref:Uncharacterized protein n=1 Tax=Polypedilum vanderplanki TaxID=319348 RepID=A0A9J6BT66_POLVA|nr:hypothetical protein PVAND_002992 [Polypedilum vanderplanki]